jgi:hypothetical protein
MRADNSIHLIRAAQHRPEPSTPLPARQCASDDSPRQRREIANRRNRELADENRRLRRQLACALANSAPTPGDTMNRRIAIR